MRTVHGILSLALAGLSFCPVAALAAGRSAWEVQREAQKNRPRPLILNADGNEMVYYPTNAPVSVSGFVSQRLSTYAHTRVSTLSYCPWSSGFGLMSTMRAGEFFDRPIDLREGCTNAAPLFAAKGLDCLDMTAAFCRTNGMEIFVSIRVNDTHDNWYFRPGTNPKRSWLFPQWKADNPDCLYGTDRQSPPHGSWTAVDFGNPKTRAYMRKFVGDFVNNYDVDGIEYDFLRHGQLFRTVGWGARATEVQLKLMTDFMLELRAITEAAGRKRGKPVLVMVRTPDSIDYAKGIGIDVKEWLRRGVMDLWSVSDYFQLDYLGPNVALAHRHGVKFYSALAESRVPWEVAKFRGKGRDARILPGRNTVASYAAEYAAAMAAGCDGVESFNLSCLWSDANRHEFLGIDPRRTEGLDRTYFALVRGSGGYEPEEWLKDGGSCYRRPRIDPGRIGPTREFSVPTDRDFTFAMELGDESRSAATVSLIVGTDGRAVKAVKVNGRALAFQSETDGTLVYRAAAGQLRRGRNEVTVVPDPAVGPRLPIRDFAISVKRK